jgi:hypothetical protein
MFTPSENTTHRYTTSSLQVRGLEPFTPVGV